MKIAFLVSGTYRSATDCICELVDWLRRQPDVDIVDVYIHAWWHPSYVGKRYRYDSLTIVEEDPTNEILERIKPKGFLLEEQAFVDLSGLPMASEAGGESWQRESANFSMISQMISLIRCYNLIKNPEEYDIVFRCRGDMVLDNPNYVFNINLSEIKKKQIWLADGQFFTGWPYGDWAFFGNPETMKQFIFNWETGFRFISQQIGKQPHIHTYIPILFNLLQIQLIRWDIPLKTTRFFEKYSKHYKMDTNPDPTIRPFFWHMIPPERLLF